MRRRADENRTGQDMNDRYNYRAEDRRAGIYGESTFADRTYDPARYRDEPGPSEDRDRDRNFSENPRAGVHRGGHDFGYGAPGTSSGLRSGAEYGGFGRGTDYGSFNQGADLVYGAPYGRGSDQSRRTDYVGRGPKGYKRADERIREDVCHRLERHPLIDASEIEVEVKDGLVFLRGSVHDRRQKRLAEVAVEDLRGVRDVRNELSASASPKS